MRYFCQKTHQQPISYELQEAEFNMGFAETWELTKLIKDLQRPSWLNTEEEEEDLYHARMVLRNRRKTQ